MSNKIDNIKYENSNTEKKFKTDIVVATIPNYELKKLINFDSNYQNKLDTAEYLGASVFILKLKKRFSKYYWINIIDKDVPFLGLIEHTNLVDKKYYDNEHILYITNYLHYKDNVFSKDKEELLKEYIKHLKIINPEFNENWIKNYIYNSVSAAQPLLPVNYSSLKPSFKSPVRNLYIGNTSQIYPEDRGTNYSVKIAGEIVSLIIKESK